MEFLEQVWAWIQANGLELLAMVDIPLVVSVIVSMFKQKKTLMDNTLSNKEIKGVCSSVEKQATVIESQGEEIKTLTSVCSELKEIIDYLTIKDNAILDILHTVYSGQSALTQTARETVDTLYANAKYAESKDRATIIKELEDLKKNILENANAAAQTVEEKTKKVKKIVEHKTTVSLA